MLDEYEAAAAGFRFPAAPVQPPHPIQEHAFANAMQALLFAARPVSGYDGTLAGQTFPPASQTAISPKPQCSLTGCKRKPAVECGLCKGCCEGRGSGCSSSKHRTGPPRTKKISSFVPDRPPAASLPSPVVANASTALSSTRPPTPVVHSTATSQDNPMPTPRSFREDMPKEWANEWNAREKEVEERRAVAELKKHNELAIARQVVIQLWREVSLLRPFLSPCSLLT